MSLTKRELQKIEKIFVKAEALLSKPKSWCRDTLARDEHGNDVTVTSKKATQFCIYGACFKANATKKELPRGLRYFLEASLPKGVYVDVAHYNDYTAKNRRQVVGVLRRAAARVRKSLSEIR